MISRNELRRIARARLKDAEALYAAGRYDGALYLCGYAVELALKARICRTLKWDEFPSSPKEFASYQSFRTHSLLVLLALSGVERKVRARHVVEWSAVTVWNAESRYIPVGTTPQSIALAMIEGARVLLRVL
jgi:HEPN domain-containing protein